MGEILRLIVPFALGATFALPLAACGGGEPAALAARELSREHRMALTDTVRSLADSVMKAISSADTSLVTMYLHDGDGTDASFGGAGAMFGTGAAFRDNLALTRRSWRSFQAEAGQHRVTLLGRDGAVTTGWGNFTGTDTSGMRGRGIQAFTMGWARTADGWKVVQLHFSARLSSVERPRADAGER